MEISFMSFLENAGLLGLIILIVELVKKYLTKEQIEKLKKKKFFTTLCIIVSFPMSIITCLKDGAFRPENHVTVIIGYCILFFVIYATGSPFFYDAILKKLIKKREELSE